MNQKITKKDIENFSNFWEYDTSEEIKNYLRKMDNFYSTPNCVATINKVNNLNGLPIQGVKVNLYGTITSNVLTYLKQTYSSENIILELINCSYLDECFKFNDFGFTKQEFVIGTNKYSLHNTQYFINQPKDYLQNIYLEMIGWGEICNLNNIIIKKMNEDEILDYIYDKKNGTTKYLKDESHSIFAGFHYFGNMAFETHRFEHYYIVALYNETIVGVISVKAYDKSRNYDGSLLLKFISYIDVREDCKRMGLANKLISYLNKIESDLIIGTDMSVEGKLANIHNVFKRHLNTKWFSSYEQYFLDNNNKNLR